MTTKKTRFPKKVTISMDVDALHKLRNAVQALSELGVAIESAVDDPGPRRDVLES